MTLARKVAPIPALTSPHRKDAECEAWICERLHLPHLFEGVTDKSIRRDRLKVVILERGLSEAGAGRLGGKGVSWRALFKQLYGEELTTKGDDPC